MKIIAVTMAYNEGDRLRRWVEYYGKQLGRENLLIVDHGSNDGSTNIYDVSRIRLHRSEFDDIQRATFISDLSRSLSNYFDVMIYTDCDEIIVADPDLYKGLRECIESSDAVSIRPIGFDLFHVRSREPKIDIGRPILQQRKFCIFRSVLCKPSIARGSVRWAPGFHHCDKLPHFDPYLYLFHTKQVDYELALKRQEVTRNLEWSERSIVGKMGAHQRLNDEEMTRVQFEQPEELLSRVGSKQFSEAAFSFEIANLMANLKFVHGIYRCDPYSGSCFEVPERLRTIF